MVHILLQIFLVNIFWLSFLIPGFTLYEFLRCHLNNSQEDYFLRKVIFSFFLSFIFFLPLAIIPYFYILDSRFAAGYFFALVIISVFFLFKRNIKCLNYFRISEIITKLKNNKKLSLLVIIYAVAEFLQALYVKNSVYFGSDSWFHISKINKNVLNGFSTYDSYFTEAGQKIISPNYASNMIHIILATGSKALNILPINLWLYSVFFIHFIILGTIYVFTRELTNKKGFALFSLIVFSVVSFVFTSQFILFYSIMSSYIAMVASLFLMILLFDMDKQKFFSRKVNYILYTFTLIVISFIHQLQSDLLILFLGGFLLALFLFRKINFMNLIYLLAPFLLTLPTSIYTLYYSKMIPSEHAAQNMSDMFSLAKVSVMSLLPYLNIFSWHFYKIIILLLGLICLQKIISDKKMLYFVYYIFIFRLLLYYSPLFLLVNRMLPEWGIFRFDFFYDIMIYIFHSAVAWVAIKYFLSLNVGNYTKLFTRYITVVFVMIFMFLEVQPFSLSNVEAVASKNQEDYENGMEIMSFDSRMDHNSVVLADPLVSFVAPAVANIYIVSLDEARTDNKSKWEIANKLLDQAVGLKEKKRLLSDNDIKYIIYDKNNPFKKLTITQIELLGFNKKSETKNFVLYSLN